MIYLISYVGIGFIPAVFALYLYLKDESQSFRGLTAEAIGWGVFGSAIIWLIWPLYLMSFFVAWLVTRGEQ